MMASFSLGLLFMLSLSAVALVFGGVSSSKLLILESGVDLDFDLDLEVRSFSVVYSYGGVSGNVGTISRSDIAVKPISRSSIWLLVPSNSPCLRSSSFLSAPPLSPFSIALSSLRPVVTSLTL